MSKLKIISVLVITFILALSACNLPSRAPATEDPGAISTNAALTVQALLNQATPFSTPTLPPAAPTNTTVVQPPTTVPPSITPALPSATPVCDLAQFISETIPDGTNFNAGDSFTKTWRFRNVGNCAWSGYALVFDSGEAMSGVSPISIGTVNPGQEVDLSANLKAPASNGTYRGYWRIRNASGVLIPVQGGYQGKSFFVEIKVGGGGSSGGPFAVTSVNMSVSGSCGGFTITANVTANGAGNVTYKWIRSDGATDTNVHPPIVFASAGSQSVNTTWSVSAPASSFWMDIYIDSPNHQQFGQANFSCP
jgi:hypothetical protein